MWAGDHQRTAAARIGSLVQYTGRLKQRVHDARGEVLELLRQLLPPEFGGQLLGKYLVGHRWLPARRRLNCKEDQREEPGHEAKFDQRTQLPFISHLSLVEGGATATERVLLRSPPSHPGAEP